MGKNKVLMLLLLVAVLLVIGFFLFRYFDNGEVARTSVLNAEPSDGTTKSEEIITPNHFQKSSKNYEFELTDSGEVVER